LVKASDPSNSTLLSLEIQTNDTAYFLGHQIRHRDGPLDAFLSIPYPPPLGSGPSLGSCCIERPS
jgi:hypothetical protein